MEKRTMKRNAFYNSFKFEDVASMPALYAAAKDASKGVKWKASVQKFLLNALLNVWKLHHDLTAGRDVRRGFTEFDIWERGKKRHIRSLKFYERVAQKSICTNALYPILTHGLVKENTSNRKGMGQKAAVDGIINDLRRHFRQYGNAGYIIKADFKTYFDSINHDCLKNIHARYVTDERTRRLAAGFIDAFGSVGLGLGSETSQINATAYPNRLDHWIKEQGRPDGFGRYMDDVFIFTRDLPEARRILDGIKRICETLKITLSEKKTRIVPFKDGIEWLKTRFSITGTGKILKRPAPTLITRERRKLKRQKRILTPEEALRSFVSWTGCMLRRNARRTVFNMRRLLED